MDVIIIIALFATVIILGHVLNMNYGLLGIAFAFIGGCLICGFSPNKVLGFWSVKLFFQIFSITFFYAFAINNGTLELLTKKLVYTVRRTTFLIPIVLFLLAGILAGIGPGSIAIMLILTPLFTRVSKQIGLHPVMNAAMIITGISAGCWSPICVSGIALSGLMETAGCTPEEITAYGNTILRNAIIASTIIFIAVYVIFRAWRCRAFITDKPEDFNKQQKISIVLIVLLSALLIIPPTLNALFGGPVFTWMTSYLDATFLAIIFGLISLLFKLGDEKKALLSVPWGTIIMVCGMGMLIGVASEVGAITYLSEFISRSFSTAMIPVVFAFVSGIMSIFSSTLGVVVPLLYPIIMGISAANGMSPALLFSIVPLAAGFTGTAPFSLFGGLVMTTAEENEKKKLFTQLIMLSASVLLGIVLLTALRIVR